MVNIQVESGDSYGVSKHCESSDVLIQLNESKTGDQIRVRLTQAELADLVDSLIDLQNPK